MEEEVKKWSSSTNRFRMERDDLAERNADLTRQLNLDSSNLSQAEYQNQKLQQELNSFKLGFEKLEREVVAAKVREEKLQGALEDIRKQKLGLESNVMELQRKHDAHERNIEMNKNYRINNTPHFLYQRPLEMQTSDFSVAQKREIYDNAQDQGSGRYYGYQEIQNESRPTLVGSGSNLFKGHVTTTIADDRRSQVGGGVLGREFSENNRYNATSPTGNQMVSVLGKKVAHNITSLRRPEGQLPLSPAQSIQKNRNTRTGDRIFPAEPLNRHIEVDTVHTKATKNSDSVIINSSRFPLDFADVSDNENKQRAEVEPQISQVNVLKESTAEGKRGKDKTVKARAAIQAANGNRGSSVMSFQEAMENARRKKAEAAKETSAESATFSMPSPQKDAAKYAAKQTRAHFKIEDPPSSRVAPVTLLSKEEKEQVQLQRVKRYEAAPFATEHSLNLQKKQMSDIEKQLVKLGLEKTMLETELMKNESLARRRMDARHRQKELENRLGEIALMSSKMRRKLKEVEGR